MRRVYRSGDPDHVIYLFGSNMVGTTFGKMVAVLDKMSTKSDSIEGNNGF